MMYVAYRVYIQVVYIPSLGLAIGVFDCERKQGYFRRSTEGARFTIRSSGVAVEGLQVLSCKMDNASPEVLESMGGRF